MNEFVQNRSVEVFDVFNYKHNRHIALVFLVQHVFGAHQSFLNQNLVVNFRPSLSKLLLLSVQSGINVVDYLVLLTLFPSANYGKACTAAWFLLFLLHFSLFEIFLQLDLGYRTI